MVGETPDLLPRVAETWRDLGTDADPAPVRDLLAGLYTEPHRVYHDLSHIHECLTTFDEVRELAERPGEVAAALLFHDAVYRTGAKDNEEASARLADRVLEEARVQADVRERVFDMILDTRHNREPEHPDARLVVDIDLAGLAFDEDEFLRNTARLLEEFRRAGIEDGPRRTAGFLRHLTERDWIYQTPFFRDRREERARRNLEQAIRKLGEGEWTWS